ncbi:hypothetical protein J7T55_011403 [Diaporthe amygdali]|uniref:uncharacterized protein n=1 Tax=Phomopsis amygdali TaxID=1214568 RepID=UPI0022FF2DC0|nr:uncharacterized protein J7T55_011403 [Diaporthe amygdali]KAJ0122942.1 hypothetical protein J7T55_011403 [Diaporthe amygdali]
MSFNKQDDMENLHRTTMRAFVNLHEAFKQSTQEDNGIKLQIDYFKGQDSTLAQLKAREALYEHDMEVISSQKSVVEAAASACDPKGKTWHLLTAFSTLVQVLQKDRQIRRKTLEVGVEILKAIDSIEKQKEQLKKDELAIARHLLEIKHKEEQQELILNVSWDSVTDQFGFMG